MQWIEVLGNYCIRLGRYVKSEGGNGCKVLEQIRLSLYPPYKIALDKALGYYSRIVISYLDGISQSKIVPLCLYPVNTLSFMLASVFPSGVNANART